MNLASKITLVLFIFLGQIFNGFSQNNEDNYRIIPSVTDWIEEINNWPEDEYRQSYIKIHFDIVKDKNLIALNDFLIMEAKIDSFPRIIISKPIIITNFQFHFDKYQFDDVALKNIHFKEDIRIFRLLNGRLTFKNCVFDKLHQVRIIKTLFYLDYYDCIFNGYYQHNNPEEPLNIEFNRCIFNEPFYISSDQGVPNVKVVNSQFEKAMIFGENSRFNSIHIDSVTVKKTISIKNLEIYNTLELTNSTLGYFNIDGTKLQADNSYIPFKQISKKIALTYSEESKKPNYIASDENSFLDKQSYDRLIASYAKLLTIYKARSETESYNACYIEMRNKQTAYSKFIYVNNKSFSNYIVYQLNVFMRVFSDYGTKPTKAIIFSIYVILLFAFIYLFFPNSWDKHGKNRIIDRYTFFMKYMNKDAGIHEVYLEDQQVELMQYDEFKLVVESYGKTVPKFFAITALPLYKWAISGTRLSASILKRIDIMKGTWSDLPAHQRFWKSILLVSAFLAAIVYDIFIKMLNALMLSINTFTTLGFGEIPIKGLPRYLAIVQGFIGWFMLTIFSVSLISQLLN